MGRNQKPFMSERRAVKAAGDVQESLTLLQKHLPNETELSHLKMYFSIYKLKYEILVCTFTIDLGYCTIGFLTVLHHRQR